MRAAFGCSGGHREERYEQWGQLVGSVRVEGETGARRLRLRGMRDHCYGARDWRKYSRYTANWGLAEDGTFFHVGAVCIPATTKHLVYGYVGWETGELAPISSSSLSLPLLGDDGQPPSNYAVSFTAGPRSLRLEAQVERAVEVWNGGDRESHSHLRFLRFRLVDTVMGRAEVGTGFSEFEYRERKERPLDLRPEPRFPSSVAATALREPHPLVLSLSHQSNNCEALVGGKSRQLHLLSLIQGNVTPPSANFPRPEPHPEHHLDMPFQFSVPAGCTVTTAAFKTFMEDHPQLLNALQSLRPG